MNETALLSENPVLEAFVATLIAGALMTTAGAAFVFAVRRLDARLDNWMLSFAAGIMLAATFFSLLLPAIEVGGRLGHTPIRSAGSAFAALMAGGALVSLVHRLLPHEHFLKGPEGAGAERLRRIWLFVFAIALHNFPEGLSVGVAAASGDTVVPQLGIIVGIGAQNVPEGLSVAVALRSQGYTRRFAFATAALTGCLEMAGGVAGAALLSISVQLLPWALAGAAGAMLFVVSSEIIPETHRHGFEVGATTALFIGFGAMMFLDTALAG